MNLYELVQDNSIDVLVTYGTARKRGIISLLLKLNGGF